MTSRQYTLVSVPTPDDIAKERDFHLREYGHLRYFGWCEPRGIKRLEDERRAMSLMGLGAIVWAMPDGSQFTSRKLFEITKITPRSVHGIYRKDLM